MSDTGSRFAEVEALPAEFGDKILSAPSVARVRTVYGVIFPLTILAAIGLFVWGLSKAQFPDILWVLGVCLFTVLLAVRLRVGTRNQWLRRVARNEVNRRPDKIVNPDAPGVRFVEIVPKSAWNDTTLLDNASEVGFLDIQNGWLLFEGDNERYRIPASAIVKSEQDYYTRLISSRNGPRQIFYHFVVVTVNVSEHASVELPFRIRKTVSLWRSDKKASDANYELLRDINHVKQPSQPASTI